MAKDDGFGLDFLTQIVNVQWEQEGGGTFVVKSQDCQVIVGDIEKDELDKTWTNLGAQFDAIGGAFSNSGASSAFIGDKQVYVMSDRRQDDDGNSSSFIMYSENGKDWEKVYERFEVDEGVVRDPWVFEPTGIVWDDEEKTFYAAFYHAVLDLTGGVLGVLIPDGESICTSTDGKTWSLISDGVELRPGGLTDDDPSELDSHCKKPENKGEIPDGLQAYDKETKTFMKPTALKGFGPVNGADYDGENAEITIEREETNDAGEEETVTSTGTMSGPCYAVGYHGGIWVAVGGEVGLLKIDASADDGKAWKNVFMGPEIDRGAVCLAGVNPGETA
jgi:hypothetical protein